ncbi:hypothetical protein MTR72_16415 [Bradyrhizobium sp. ISRA442]|uniref:hypothetical protein n=1 Tax=Bradyrhizobium sp. ISRA442 TaxID=2866197 RepID=UPI00311AC067
MILKHNLERLEQQAQEMAADGCPEGAREALLELAERYHSEDKAHPGQARKRSSWAIAAALTIALVNIPLVTWVHSGYVEPKGPPFPNAYRLPTPYRIYPNGFVYSSLVPPQLERFADEDDDNQKSPVLLYEDDKLLPLPHTRGYVIAEKGMGRYSHQKGRFYFSSSDNTDARSNRRSYWLVLPAAP